MLIERKVIWQNIIMKELSDQSYEVFCRKFSDVYEALEKSSSCIKENQSL